MLSLIIRLILCVNILFAYYKQDPIMIALSGAYNTVAKGYQSVGVNPANLSFSTGTSISLLNMNLNMLNNFMTRKRLLDISGANLENSDAEKYFPKNDILGYLNGEPIKFNIIANLPVPGINFSKNQFSVNSELKIFSNQQFSQDIIEMGLEGNEIDRIYDLSIKKEDVVIWESSFTKAFDISPIGLGFTLKYLKGLCYYVLEPISDSYVQTTINEIGSQARYIINQNLYGDGFSLDLGLTTKQNDAGWKIGVSFINLFADIKWNKKTSFDNTLSNFYNSLPLNESESYLISLTIDGFNLGALNDVNTSSIYTIDNEYVYEVTTQPNGIENEDYYCSNEDCESYFIPSNNVNLDNIEVVKPEIIHLDYPTFMSIGMSKQLKNNKSVILDISTGLDTSFNNSEKWRCALGYIFGTERFPLRLGISYGGYDVKSIGFGCGLKLKNFNIDTGFGLKGSFDPRKSTGIDFGFNMYWMTL